MEGRTCSLLASTFILCFLVTCSSKNLNITTDQTSLLALKSCIINLEPSHILTQNWSTPSNVCTWIGVSCSRRHHRITALNISNMGLKGTIPPHLGNLSFLVSIDMKGNSFQGNLPVELAQLRRLRFLDLSSNTFTGQIPASLGFLSEIQGLSLKNNNFSGIIPATIFNLSKLEMLDLSFNSLRGKLPEEIGKLQNLKDLSIQDNQLTGSIPFELYNVSGLERLVLTRNSLSGELPDDICGRLPGLEGIYLSWNAISGRIPVSFPECRRLTLLSLSNNAFVGPIPRQIGNVTMLDTLYLGANNLTVAAKANCRQPLGRKELRRPRRPDLGNALSFLGDRGRQDRGESPSPKLGDGDSPIILGNRSPRSPHPLSCSGRRRHRLKVGQRWSPPLLKQRLAVAAFS
ncbi:UNVERIFIED_CONTAM: putative LRR receptor-like serine/threonine-protein kinase [Sesamum calycinum]|uniref:LRR receptor-like serine/threonine-protein kinase n=1 Tax=Sesamum calycinum TaxID=2727403 RepID=A0AAW2RA41_9LAMI